MRIRRLLAAATGLTVLFLMVAVPAWAVPSDANPGQGRKPSTTTTIEPPTTTTEPPTTTTTRPTTTTSSPSTTTTEPSTTTTASPTTTTTGGPSVTAPGKEELPPETTTTTDPAALGERSDPDRGSSGGPGPSVAASSAPTPPATATVLRQELDAMAVVVQGYDRLEESFEPSRSSRIGPVEGLGFDFRVAVESIGADILPAVALACLLALLVVADRRRGEPGPSA